MAIVNRSETVAGLLLMSGIALSSLIPGGPIENRDFSAISPAGLLAFNVVLTALGIGSYLLIPGVLARSARQLGLAACAGLAYAVIYALDLLGLFPRSPDPMSRALLSVEFAGLLLGVLLAWQAHRTAPAKAPSAGSFRPPPLALLLLVMVGVAVVAFAMHATLEKT